MILRPFNVNSRGTRYSFIDQLAVDSDAERAAIQQAVQLQLALMPEDAKCAALGIAETGTFGNIQLGVYDGSTLTGAFLLTSLDYQSGPWADLVDWQVTSSDPAVFHGRPMPGFPALSLADSLDLSVDAAHHMLARRIQSVGGHDVKFQRLSWAVFKGRADPRSRAANRVHDKAAADGRFRMTEAPDGNDATLTRVDIELA